MTKKSEARMVRDAANPDRVKFHDRLVINETRQRAYYAENHCWDELLQVSNQCFQLLASYSSLSKVFSNQPLLEVIGRSPDLAQRYTDNVRVLTKDLQTLNARLVELRGMHRDKTGAARDESENSLAIKIHEGYLGFQQRHEALVMPIFLQLTEVIAEAEKILYKAGLDVSQEVIEQVNDAYRENDINVAPFVNSLPVEDSGSSTLNH